MTGWENRPLGTLLLGCQYGLSDPTGEDGNVPMVGMKDLVQGYVKVDPAVRTHVSEKDAKAYRLHSGDILLNRTNSLPLVGKAGYVRHDSDAVFASYLVRLEVDRSICDARFLNYFLATHAAQQSIARIATRGVSQANVNPTQLRKRLIVPLPPLPEQEAVIEILAVAEQVLSDADALIERKVAYKKALAEDLLTGRRRFPGFPSPWREFTLGNLFVERVDPGRKGLRLLSVTGADGVVDRDSLVKRDTSSEDKSKYLRVCPGDIAYNTMRMWQGVFGLSMLEGIVSPAYTVCTPISELILPQFIEQFFKLPHTINDFKRYSQGLVDDTLNLKFHHFALIKVTIPGTDEQRRIADLLGAIDAEIALLRKQRDALNEQRKGLMQKLLTGEVRLKEFR